MNNIDLKTRLFLFLTNIKIIDNKTYSDEVVSSNLAYYFENKNNFRDYFKPYMNDVDDNVIDLAIYSRTKDNGIIALKGLCDHIITKSIVNDNYKKNKVLQKRK